MAIFYCGTEINILKFRCLLQIQLTTHTINSREDLICPLYYRVTLGTGLQQVKKLATPLSTVRKDYDMLMIVIMVTTQSSLSKMATLGTQESGRCGEVAIMGRRLI